MKFTAEADEIPTLIVIRPTFDDAGAIVAIQAQFNLARRLANDTDASDKIVRETGAVFADLFDAEKSVTVGGTVITYRKIAQALRLVAATAAAQRAAAG